MEATIQSLEETRCWIDPYILAPFISTTFVSFVSVQLLLDCWLNSIQAVVVQPYGAVVVQSYGAQDLTSGTPLVLQKVHLLGQHLRDHDD